MQRDWNHLLLKFDGRISRSDYWLGILIQILFSIPMLAIGFNVERQNDDLSSFSNILTIIIMAITIILGTWINFAVSIKRYHDRNKSGFWVLIALIPYIGAIWQLIELGFLEGTIGDNNYGKDPINRVTKA